MNGSWSPGGRYRETSTNPWPRANRRPSRFDARTMVSKPGPPKPRATFIASKNSFSPYPRRRCSGSTRAMTVNVAHLVGGPNCRAPDQALAGIGDCQEIAACPLSHLVSRERRGGHHGVVDMAPAFDGHKCKWTSRTRPPTCSARQTTKPGSSRGQFQNTTARLPKPQAYGPSQSARSWTLPQCGHPYETASSPSYQVAAASPQSCPGSKHALQSGQVSSAPLPPLVWTVLPTTTSTPLARSDPSCSTVTEPR